MTMTYLRYTHRHKLTNFHYFTHVPALSLQHYSPFVDYLHAFKHLIGHKYTYLHGQL